jgi:two-component system response regulator DevR
MPGGTSQPVTVRAGPVAEPLRLILIDDHEMVRRGMVSLLSSAPDVVVVAEASTAEAGLQLVATERPDVVLIDVVLPDGDGIAVCRRIRSRQPDVGCLLLTAHDEPEAQLATILAGAAGYLTKDQPGSVMLDSIRLVATGRPLLDPGLAARLMSEWRTPSDESVQGTGRAGSAALTPGEQHLLALVGERWSDAEIADRLTVPERAVQSRLAVIFAKIGLERRISGDVHGRKMGYRTEPDAPWR